MSISVTNLSKHYGAQKAVNNISFTINKGEIVGFLGPNGAGKSTTMKMITGYLAADAGQITVCGIVADEQNTETKKKIGYLPEANPLYMEMYVREYLAFIAGVHKIADAKKRVEEVIVTVGLSPESHKKIGQLSKGYKQRVGLAAALVHNPEVLILDEPTSGLDPNQIVEIREVIKKLGQDKTVLFSSHIMQEVEAICDRVIIIDNGKIVTDKKLDKLVSEEKEQIIEVEFDKKIDEALLANLSNIKTFKNTSDNLWTLTFATEEDMRPKVFDFAHDNGLKTLQISLKSKNLEQIFREKTKK